MRKLINLIALTMLLLAPAVAVAQSDTCENGSCDLVVQLSGYNFLVYNAKVAFYVGGNLAEEINTSQTVSVCSGDSLVVRYVPGVFPSTNSVVITNSDGTVLYNGSVTNTSDTLLAVANACPECVPPTAVHVDESTLSPTGADISWTDPVEDGMGDYIVYVDGEEVATVSGDSVYSLSGLTPGTTVTVGVARICAVAGEGSDDTSVVRTVSLHTTCDNSCDLNVQLSGYDFSSYNAQVAFYVGGNLIAQTNSSQTIEVCNGDSLVVRYLPGSYSVTNTVVITSGNGVELFNGQASGDTLVAVATACPTCVPPIAVQVDENSIDSTSATISWTDPDTTGLGDYVIYVDGEEVFTASGDSVYMLTGLTPATMVTVGVARICTNDEGDPDTSGVRTVSFRTACAGDTCQVTVSTYGFVMSEYELIQNGYSYGLCTDFTATYSVCSSDNLLLHTTSAAGFSSFTVINAAHMELFNGTANGSTFDTLDLGQPCPTCMPATNLAVEPTSDGGIVSWTPLGSASVNLWHIYVDSVEVGTTDSTSYTLTGLAINTDYTVGVRADCGVGDSSELRTVDFRTGCAEGNCTFKVMMIDIYGSGWAGNAINVYQGGELYESLYLDGGYSNTVTVSPCLGESIALVWQSGSGAFGSSFLILDANDSILLSVNGAEQCGNGDTLVVFDGQCNAEVVFTPGTVVPEECHIPTGLDTVSVDSTRAAIAWTAGGSETQWQVKLASQDFIHLVNNNSYTFYNLTPATEYRVRVRAYCSESEQSDWSDELVFTTDASQQHDTNGIVSANGMGVSLFPNPASSVVTIKAGGAVEVSIVDLNGREVYRSASLSTLHRINISTLAKGSYFVRLTDSRNTAVRKLIVK